MFNNNLNSSGHHILTRILLFGLVASFCLWGIGDIFRQTGTGGNVAKVGKMSISAREYQAAVRGRQENLRERLGKAYTPEFAKKLGVEKQALESIINRFALEQEAAAMGIVVSEDDIAEDIASNPDFHDGNGHFSKEIYMSALEANHRTEQSYVADLKTQLASTLLLGTVSANIGVPEDLVQAVYRARFEKRSASLLLIPANIKVAEPSEKDIKAYYDAHTDRFMVPEYRALSYIELKPEDVQSTITVSDTEIQKAYTERADEFHLPERRTIEQLVFEKKETADKAAQELAAGKTFAQVAAELPVLNKDKLLLGELTKPAVQVAADEVFALKEGGITKSAQSGFGWHILRVDKILPAGPRPLPEVHDDIVKTIKEKAAADAVYKLQSSFEDAMGGGATLDDAAKKLGQKVTLVSFVTRDGVTLDGSKPVLPAYSSFMEVAFNTADKDHSRMVQADNGTYFMVHVDGIKAEHAKPLAEILPQVTDAVKKEQAGKQLRATAEQMAKDLKAGKKLEDVVAGKGIAPVLEPSGALLRTSDSVTEGKLNGKPVSPDLVGDLFQSKPGSFTNAHALPDGSYMIGKLDQVIAAPDISKEGKDSAVLKPIRDELEKSMNGQAQYAYLRHLRTKYPVTYNAGLLGAAVPESDEE